MPPPPLRVVRVGQDADPGRVRRTIGRMTWCEMRRWIALAIAGVSVLTLAPASPGLALLVLLWGALALVAWQATHE